jgi:hypothetical protein
MSIHLLIGPKLPCQGFSDPTSLGPPLQDQLGLWLPASSLAQEAIRSALASENLDSWLSSVSRLSTVSVDHDEVLEAIHAAKDELEGV